MHRGQKIPNTSPDLICMFSTRMCATVVSKHLYPARLWSPRLEAASRDSLSHGKSRLSQRTRKQQSNQAPPSMKHATEFRARLRRQSDNYVPKSHRSRTRTLLVALRQTTCSQILDTPDTECLASSDRTHASGQTLTPHLAAGSHVLCGKHGRVRGCLIAVSLNLHSAGHADHGLPP